MLLFSPQFAMAKVVRMGPKLTVQSGGLHEVVQDAVESFENGDFDKVNSILKELPPDSQQLVKNALRTQLLNTPDLDKE